MIFLPEPLLWGSGIFSIFRKKLLTNQKDVL